jgi:hypothetical protein
MLRRTFLRLGGMSLFGLTSQTNAFSRNEIKLTTLKVAGLQYGYWADHMFDIDEPLVLRREPNNPHDRYAVALYYRGKKAGYIPRTNSRIVASLMDAGEKIEARVRYFDKNKEVYERLWVSLWKQRRDVG